MDVPEIPIFAEKWPYLSPWIFKKNKNPFIFFDFKS